MKCAILINEKMYGFVFDQDTLTELGSLTEIAWEAVPVMDEAKAIRLIDKADIVVTSWESPRLEGALLAAAPGLKLIAHAAGSVKPVISEEIVSRKIQVTTAAPAIGIGVAEYCLGAILMMGKRLKEQMSAVESGGWRSEKSGSAVEIYGVVAGIVGAGFVGRHLIKLLQNFELKEIRVYDPYLSEDEAGRLGVRQATLEEIFSQCDYISINAPDIPATRGMVNRELIRSIKDNAVFINTSRGAIVDEAALTEELATGRFTALLDVTDPEPPAEDHPLRRMPNVILTPHMAGVLNRNGRRVGRYAFNEINNFIHGRPLIYPVALDQLDRLA
ncbi:MAG: hydroxyacid dehydrogenase [bacterium]|nr:hydroxyacid dehydrogenase [bacterium]